MANQYVNKVIVNNEIKMDLTEDTITPKTLRKGFTAHDASGAPIVGNESLTDISEDGTDAGPIHELTANGWANQTQLSGKNLFDIRTLKDSMSLDTSSGLPVQFAGRFAVDTPTSVTSGKYTITFDKPIETIRAIYSVFAADSLVKRVANVDSGTTFDVDGDKLYICFYNNNNANDLTTETAPKFVQLEAGSTATEYEPYCGGIPSPNPDYPQDIRVAKGRNLRDWPITQVYKDSSYTGSKNTYGLFDGEVGTRVDNDFGTGIEVTYSFFTNGYSASARLYFYDSSNTLIDSAYSDYSTTRTFVTATIPAGTVKIGFGMSWNDSVCMITNPQLEYGSEVTPYVPYGFVGVEVWEHNLATSGVKQGVYAFATGGYVDSNLYYVCTEKLPCEVGVSYLLNLKGFTPNNYYVEWFRSDDTFISHTIATKTEYGYISVPAPDDAAYIAINFYKASGDASPSDVSSVYVGKGYIKTIPVPLPERGWVGGLSDGTSDILKLNTAGKYEWIKNTAEIVISGPLAFKEYESHNQLYGAIISAGSDMIGINSKSMRNNILLSHFQAGNTGDGYHPGYGYLTGSGRTIVLNDADKTTFTSQAEANAWLSQNPVTVLYPLEAPQTEQGYVPNWDNTLPEHCTIDIPELRDISVRYYIDTASVEPTQRYYERANAELNQVIDDASNDATLEALAAIAPIEGDISSANYLVGAYLIHDNQLCEVTTPIATGEVITVGTNVVISSVATELGELQVAVQDIIDDPYILPTMSASEKGGAKVGQGLRIDDDILSVDMSSGDATDAGPLISLQAEGWAEQTQLTGKNLLPTSLEIMQAVNRSSNGFTWNGNVATKNGVTATVNADNSITFSGQNTSESIYTFIVCRPADFIELGSGTYTLSGGFSGGGSEANSYGINAQFYDGDTANGLQYYEGSTHTKTFSTSVTIPTGNNVYFYIGAGVSLSQPVTIYPQLELGSTATEYEPYCGGVPSPNPNYPQEIRVARGRNLFDPNASTTVVGFFDDTHTITVLGDRLMYYIPCTEGETYTASRLAVAENDRFRIGYTTELPAVGVTVYGQYGTPSSQTVGNKLTVSTTIGKGGKYVVVWMYWVNGPEALKTFQLELGSQATPYVPYGFVGVEAQGKNLLKNTQPQTCTINGVTWTKNEDGSVTANGTASGSSYAGKSVYYINGTASKPIAEGTYILSDGGVGSENGWVEAVISHDGSNLYRGTKYGKIVINALSDATITIYIMIISGATVNNLTFYPQLEHGSVAHPYEPYYHQTIPIPLPSKGFAAALPDGTSDILHLDGAGKWEWVENTTEYIVTGNEGTGQAYTSIGDGWGRTTPRVLTKLSRIHNATSGTSGYCTHGIFEWKPNQQSYYIATSSNIVLFVGQGETPLDISQQYAGAQIIYALETPQTEQGYLDNWDNNIPLHATIDIPELRNIGVECYMDEQASTLNLQWSERLRSEMDDTSTNAVTESLASLAPVENDISSANYSIGSYLIHNNQLYKVTSPIVIGETISTSTNVTAVTLSDDVKYLNDHPYILPTMSEDTKGGAKVGHGLYVENDILSVGRVTDPTDAGPIVELSAKGLAEQNGTPSPDSPVDIEVVRGRNLLPCVVATTTNNGITFTVNSDGTIVANGTVSYSYATLILLNATKLQSLPVIGKSVTLTLSGCPAGGGSSTYQLIATLGDDGTTIVLADNDAGITRAFTNMQCPSAGNVYIRIYGNGRTVNNLVFKPQLEIGSVATPYVPHGYIGVDVQNKNLCPVPKQQTIVSNGVTFTVNDDGSVNVVGETSNAYASCTLDEKFILGAGTYTISGVNGNVIFEIREDFSDGTYTFYNTTNTKTITLDHDAYINRMYLVVIPDKTVNTTVYPQLEKASTATSYEPYHHQTIPIPLPERGWVASLPDGTSDILYLDGAGGYMWELNTNEVLLDGSIACDYISASTVHTDALRARVAAVTGTPSRNAYNGRSSHFTSGSTASWANMGVGQFYLDGSGVILGMPIATIDTTEKVTAWLQSNPVTILYALTTPQTESGYVDMPTIPARAILSTELTGLTVRCCADAGAAEISQAWAKRFKMELDELREIVNGLT